MSPLTQDERALAAGGLRRLAALDRETAYRNVADKLEAEPDALEWEKNARAVHAREMQFMAERDEAREALRQIRDIEPLPEGEAGRDSPMDEAIDAMHEIADRALQGVEHTHALVPVEICSYAAESMPQPPGPIAQALAAAARGERVKWPA